MPTKYTVFCVDLFGLAVASYDLHAGDDDAAKTEARQFLASHPSGGLGRSPMGCSVGPRGTVFYPGALG
jgi:hypothetical protein